MVIAVLADDASRKEFLSQPLPEGAEILWADSLRALGVIEADVYFDLLFEADPQRIGALGRLASRPVIINSVVHTLREIGRPFIRINGWPTMLGRDTVEICGTGFPELGWRLQQVPDITGMVTPRIISTIINEAWFTLGEAISSKEEIDTAMKLGTNYPYGPFEWGDKIGLNRVIQLLRELGRNDNRYAIAPALLKHIENGADPEY